MAGKSVSPNTGAGMTAYAVAKAGGFSGDGIGMTAAIGKRESSGNIHAINVNNDGSRDRGWLQINDKAHPDVSDSCAFNPVCAAKATYKISKGGTDWSAWSSSGGSPSPIADYPLNENGRQVGKDMTDPLGIKGAIDTVTSPISAVGDLIHLFTTTAGLERVAKTIGGAAIILMSLYIMMKKETAA